MNQVPCPYLRLYVSLPGQKDDSKHCTPLDTISIDHLLRRHVDKQMKRGKLHVEIAAQTTIEEEHPFLGIPAACLHICGIPERLAIMQGQQTIEDDRGLYLLQWFSLVGPYLGMPIDSGTFQRVSSFLLET